MAIASPQQRHKIAGITLSILIAQAAGIIGSLFTASSVQTWYATLTLPTWNPPSFIFGPVWITLYTLMGIAAYLVWKKKKATLRKQALSFYAAQLALNALWSIIFFGMKNPGLAFFELCVLLAAIYITTYLFWKSNKWAGILMLPYVAWASFAAFLNFTIWQLNI